MTAIPWQPTASIATLKARAEILAKIREFFAIRGVIEVETPLLSLATVTDPHISSLTTYYAVPNLPGATPLYLQTSPEFAMKRLLAAGMGSIYQITKAFRVDERSRYHNPEFTMLEWYRVGFSHRDLMIEVDGLLRRILQCEVAECLSYGDLFGKYCGINPYQTTVAELKACAQRCSIDLHDPDQLQEVTPWLQLLMSHVIEPQLGQNNRPSFVIDFPIAQAALAKADPYRPEVAERFEVYWRGMELANGFHELCDVKEQRRRFEADNAWRKTHHLPEVPLDDRFLAALAAGLPPSAGVALGVDRLVMAALGIADVAEVVAFPVELA